MYEFTRLNLTEDEFNNLLFMNPPNDDDEDNRFDDSFLKSICSAPLNEVTQMVIEESSYKGGDPTLIFQGIDREPQPGKGAWFGRHALLSQHFHRDLLGELWIRNLTQWTGETGNLVGERPEHPECSFYLADGNHRALVYAIHIACGKCRYEPMEAIHATSWDIASGILGWQPNPAHALEHHGKLKGRKQYYRDRYHMHIQLYDSN